MKDTPLQFTLRELHAIGTSYRFWIGMVAVILIVSIAGPFGTSEQLPFVIRLFYWSITAILTFFCGLSVSLFIGLSLHRIGLPDWMARAAGGILAGLPVAGLVWSINEFGFGLDMGGLEVFLRVWMYCTGISVSVMVLYFLVQPNQEQQALHPRFLDRLPTHLGKNLWHLSSQDHYVEAVTEKGSELILMRFSDALNELSEADGIQVHRAHWVSLHAIKKPVRKDGKLFLEMIDGTQFPVSRSHNKAVRAVLNL